MTDETKNPNEPKAPSLEPPKDIEELLKELPKVAPQNQPPKPVPIPASPKPFLPNPSPPPSSSSQPFKSSIRTMAEDLEAAKKGLKPESKPFEIKPPPPPPAPPAPSAPRPPLGPQVRLGTPEKSKIIEAPKIIPPPPSGPPRSPLGLPPPSGRKLPISPKLLLLVLGGVVILISTWYFLTRKDEEAAAPTPVTTQTPTPTPIPKTLSQLITSANQITISPTQDLLMTVSNSSTLTAGSFTSLNLIDENGIPYSLNQIFQKSGTSPPNGLLENLDSNEWVIAVYGQQEMFDQNGLLNFNQTPKMKIGLIAKSSNPELLRSAMNTWENTMANDLKNLFGLDLKKASSQTFLDNIYSGVNIRYRNFPFADNTLDYAIVDLPEFGLSYLVITSSREAIYSAVNLLQNQ